MPSKKFPRAPFLYGCCYYPEHWDPRLHGSDLRRMAKAGFNLVRMGEGAWSYFEPREGQFQFALFDRVLDLCLKYGIRVIMGTPTYAGPAWIASNYPETLRWDFQRRPMGQGGRRHYNYSSPKYLDLSDRICRALAAHYKGHGAIIGWQLDNEFNCHMDVSYAPSDTLAFRVWLKERYKTIAKLNQAWGTAFWSQTYDSWDQIDLPKPVPAYPNPSQLLDESRFISDQVCAFARRQARIMRGANPRWFITHNALFSNIKGPDLAQALDFFSHDQYPGFFSQPSEASVYLAQARSLSFPFGLLEQQSGPGGQMAYLLPTLRPGQQRLHAWQSMAHGASLLAYFLWRTVPFGSEQHWHGLVDADNKDCRRLSEAILTGQEIRRIPKAFWTAPPVRQAAFLRDYDNEINEQRINTYPGKGRNELIRWHSASVKEHLGLDQIWEHSDWARYSLIIAPHLKIVTTNLARRLRAYVEKGGILFLGAQSGSKDENLHSITAVKPGLLASLAGIEVEDWTSLKDDDTRSAGAFELGSFVERLLPKKNTEVLARWNTEDSLLSGAAALTRNRVGKGWVYYLGGYAQEEAIRHLIGLLRKNHALPAPVTASPDVEVVVRAAGKRRWTVLMNHAAAPRNVAGLDKGTDLLNGSKIDAALVLPAFGVAVVEQ